MNVLRQEREDMQKAMDQQREMRDALMAERDSLRKEREDSRRMAADTRASIEVRPRLRERKTRSPMPDAVGTAWRVGPFQMEAMKQRRELQAIVDAEHKHMESGAHGGHVHGGHGYGASRLSVPHIIMGARRSIVPMEELSWTLSGSPSPHAGAPPECCRNLFYSCNVFCRGEKVG
eukprot:1639211-Pyramimonas_sp.AAC.2